ncbi:ATP synthase subunit gamma mitochondrial [Prunus yedoensis var. nudiflora]|uniref:ATP synthase subunit gamma mitochondrial n=1 Tax=Prunus yedoensis var. nudiflora TaxID=2094558 RepID=A0A314ZB65_PRUYE|nr:ATP synthase subunit gamma mitochondrial [Prunus yedoensis var. nudiflora]
MPGVQVKKDVIVTFSSDKGLCGGINSTSVKISNALNKLNSGPDKETKYVILREKAKAQLIRGSKKDIELCLTELPKNSLNYTQIVERESESGGRLGELDSYEIEGGETKSEILQNLAEFQFSCVMFNAVLENACSKQGARMSALDSSSRNAGEMLDRLTLTYNRPPL